MKAARIALADALALTLCACALPPALVALLLFGAASAAWRLAT